MQLMMLLPKKAEVRISFRRWWTSGFWWTKFSNLDNLSLSILSCAIFFAFHLFRNLNHQLTTWVHECTYCNHLWKPCHVRPMSHISTGLIKTIIPIQASHIEVQCGATIPVATIQSRVGTNNWAGIFPTPGVIYDTFILSSGKNKFPVQITFCHRLQVKFSTWGWHGWWTHICSTSAPFCFASHASFGVYAQP